MEVKTIARRWGSSIAVVIPKEVADMQRIKENSEITITIQRQRPIAGEMFGLFSRASKKTAQQIKDEIRSGWESESDRKRWKR